ncbi:hypothetical protein AVEN_135520-1 [Araneus ventricosus]|uniref:Uncharacterized protein n=1 Tax=Araneus ventricosus TaxID=182803 RepID=A0A4Y2Q5J6_ARAVE|nr:hypothetical protein AVEN_135520-1 [Araneus ventricosus]
MKKGGFELRDWEFSAPRDVNSKTIDLLGLKWNKSEDIPSINLKWLKEDGDKEILDLFGSLSNGSRPEALKKFRFLLGSNIFPDYGSLALILTFCDEINAIDWKFNLPTTAWWEKLIRIMKDLLKRVLGKAYLSHEEMMTVLCDCEAIINSRHLTYVSENDTDFTPISPSMFIQDIREWTVPNLDVANHNSLNSQE